MFFVVEALQYQFKKKYHWSPSLRRGGGGGGGGGGIELLMPYSQYILHLIYMLIYGTYRVITYREQRGINRGCAVRHQWPFIRVGAGHIITCKEGVVPFTGGTCSTQEDYRRPYNHRAHFSQ